LAAAAAVAVVVLHQFAVARLTATTALQDVTPMDKVGKAELKLQEEMAELLGQEHLQEDLLEH
jgi:hypothetical protein